MGDKEQFLAASREEGKRVEQTLREWRNKLAEAEKKVKYWELQWEAITSVITRLDIEISQEKSK